MSVFSRNTSLWLCLPIILLVFAISNTIFAQQTRVDTEALADRIAVLRAGRIEQIGTPEQLYNAPETQFVAQFIGNPPMNLLPVIVGAGSTLLLGRSGFRWTDP